MSQPDPQASRELPVTALRRSFELARSLEPVAQIQECVDRLTYTGSIWFLSPERWADEVGLMLKGLLPRRNRIIWRETFGQYRETVFPSGHRHLFWHVKDLKNSPFYTDEIRVVSQRMIDGDKRAAGPRVPPQSVYTRRGPKHGFRQPGYPVNQAHGIFLADLCFFVGRVFVGPLPPNASC